MSDYALQSENTYQSDMEANAKRERKIERMAQEMTIEQVKSLLTPSVLWEVFSEADEDFFTDASIWLSRIENSDADAARKLGRLVYNTVREYQLNVNRLQVEAKA